MSQHRLLAGICCLVSVIVCTVLAVYSSAQARAMGTTTVVLHGASWIGGVPSIQAMAQARLIEMRRLQGDASLVSLLNPWAPEVRVTAHHKQRFLDITLRALDGHELQETIAMLSANGHAQLVAVGARTRPLGAGISGLPVLADNTRGAWLADLGVDNWGVPAVDLRVEGGARAGVETYSATHIGTYVGVAVDGRLWALQKISQRYPNGQLQITNFGTTAAVRNFAALLSYGRLPVHVNVVQQASNR